MLSNNFLVNLARYIAANVWRSPPIKYYSRAPVSRYIMRGNTFSSEIYFLSRVFLRNVLLGHKNTYLAAGRQFFIVRVVGGFLLLIAPIFSQNAARDINGSGGRRQVYCCWVKRRHCKVGDVLKGNIIIGLFDHIQQE